MVGNRSEKTGTLRIFCIDYPIACIVKEFSASHVIHKFVYHFLFHIASHCRRIIPLTDTWECTYLNRQKPRKPTKRLLQRCNFAS